MNLRDFKIRARSLFRPRRAERDLGDELAFHMEREAQKLIEEGVTPAAARARARTRFGSITVVADQCREQRGTAFVDDAIRDVQYALRSFARAPLAALTVVVTIALGLGVVAVLFTFFNSFLFRVDQVPDVEQFYAVERRQPGADGPSSLTLADFESLRRDTSVFIDSYAAVSDIDLPVNGRTMAVTLVTGNFFELARVRPSAGRTLNASDDASNGANPVIVLSHKGWSRRFDRDPNVVGRTVVVGDVSFAIVGVMPEGFRGLAVGAPDFWAPLGQLGAFRPGQRGREKSAAVGIAGRLKPSVSPDSARAQLRAWDSNRSASAADPRATAIEVRPHHGTLPQPMEALLLFAPLFTAFGLILLIGCANVANLLLARGVARQREIGIRLSIGASRRRIVRQLMTESLLLALLAAAGGYRRVAPRAHRCSHLGGQHTARRSRRCESERSGCRLASGAVSRGRGSGVHRVVRADAGAAGHPDRSGADAPRRTGQGCPPRPRPQCARRRAGVRINTALDLRLNLLAQRDGVRAIRSGHAHCGHRDDPTDQRAEAGGHDPGDRDRSHHHAIRGGAARHLGRIPGTRRDRRNEDGAELPVRVGGVLRRHGHSDSARANVHPGGT